MIRGQRYWLCRGVDNEGEVSPIEWDNVILYGQYVLDRALVR